MQNMIQARNVRRCFRVSGNDFWALKGVDMDVPAGALTILRGRSGSGKTTLMNILGALDAPTEGSVLFDGQDIVALDDHARTKLRRERIGFVFQSVALIPMMTALENVEYALRLARYRGDRRERALECLHLVGLSARQKHMPQELSGGEQQRVAIARAIAHRPGDLRGRAHRRAGHRDRPSSGENLQGSDRAGGRDHRHDHPRRGADGDRRRGLRAGGRGGGFAWRMNRQPR